MAIVVTDNTGDFQSEFDSRVMRALEAIGIEAEGDAVDYIEENDIIDTGRLMGSITHRVDNDGKAVIVGTNVEYAPYVHNGTSRMKARPFLVEPISRNGEWYRKIAEAAMKGN